MIQVQSTDSGNTLSIQVAGRFDFSTNAAFRSAYQGQERKGIKYRVDFCKTDYMDSSALGMLLNLKQYADDKIIVIVFSMRRMSPQLLTFLKKAQSNIWCR